MRKDQSDRNSRALSVEVEIRLVEDAAEEAKRYGSSQEMQKRQCDPRDARSTHRSDVEQSLVVRRGASEEILAILEL
jgi:hypothetical protein